MRSRLPADALYAGIRRQWLDDFPKPASLKYTREVMREYYDRKAHRAAFLKGPLHTEHTM